MCMDYLYPIYSKEYGWKVLKQFGEGKFITYRTPYREMEVRANFTYETDRQDEMAIYIFLNKSCALQYAYDYYESNKHRCDGVALAKVKLGSHLWKSYKDLSFNGWERFHYSTNRIEVLDIEGVK